MAGNSTLQIYCFSPQRALVQECVVFLVTVVFFTLTDRAATISMYVWSSHTTEYDQPGKVANPARGQLIRENEYSPVPVRAWEFGLARRVQPSCSASACSSPYSG